MSVVVCRLSSVTLCIVAKRCVLEQKLLLRAHRKSYMRNRLAPKRMTLTFVQRSYQGYVKHCAAFGFEYLGNRYRQRLGSKGPPIGNDIWAIKWSHDRWCHVTLKGQTRDPNALRAQYLEDLETPFQRTTNRKWHMGYQMVTWPMTSRDSEGSVMQYDRLS